jgi:predicted DNA-binding transcriptional regulator AlpA
MNLPFTYLPLDAVLTATGIRSKSKLYAMIKRGEFPEPDRLSVRCSRWRSDVLAGWLEEVAAVAEREREERTKAAIEKAQGLVLARHLKAGAAA